MSTSEPTSTIEHGGERSPYHPAKQWAPARWHGKVTRRGQPIHLALWPMQGQKFMRCRARRKLGKRIQDKARSSP